MTFDIPDYLVDNTRAVEGIALTPYALWKASGLSRKTVYDITGGKLIRMDFSTLGAVITGLEALTHKRVEPNGVLEVVRGAQ
ncbi:MAG: hypothetical protein C4332_06325 [Meiothermus sp.]